MDQYFYAMFDLLKVMDGFVSLLHLFASSIDLDDVEKGNVRVKSIPEGTNVGFLGTDDKVSSIY